MIDFIIAVKGKLIGIVVAILLLVWWIPWHYYRYKFMIEHNYETYLIWNEMGSCIFFSIFAVVFLISLGHIFDITSKSK